MKNNLILKSILVCSLLIPFGLPVPAQVSFSVKDKPGGNEKTPYRNKIKTLDKKEISKFLKQRVQGIIGNTFSAFSNMYLIKSRIELDSSIALTTDSETVSRAPLEPAFPLSYEPTVREFLDAVALQSGSKWVYDEKYQVAHSTKPLDKPMENVVIFHFLPASNSLPYEITPAERWKKVNRTNWIMYIPPGYPVGMDLHVQGKLSSPSDEQSKLLENAAPEAALDRLKMAKPDATRDSLKLTKVGKYEAYFFEENLPPRNGEKVIWREWHFMVGDQLLYVISTLPERLDKDLYPDVKKMIASFNVIENEKEN